MRAYTERGLRATSGGLRGARALLVRRVRDLQAQAGLIEAELSAHRVQCVHALSEWYDQRKERT